MRNQLGEESSPYLLQHKDNPVHWRPWGAAAFAEAAARQIPILLSIGYAACHWCHVMAHESFEDERVAEIMNAHFVSIKVDREERPDIDQTYMAALHAMGEQGGWPLTMVLTPKGEAFWGGTYFPPVPRFGRPSFTQVLQALSQAWANDQDRIASSTATITQALRAQSATRPGDAPGPDTLSAIAQAFLRNMDWDLGGFGSAPKFPNIPVYRFLWHEHFRAQNAQAGEAVTLLLTRMSQGGIYDHLGGGYARYATDDAWLIPHFEKMLYDNALILDMLALTYAQTKNPLYAARAHETVEWLTRDMRTEGAFAASEDADSEGEEGKFYVWTRAEIVETLGGDLAFFESHYPAPAHGNWEGHIILERRTEHGAQEDRLKLLRDKLLTRRSTRIRPGRDDKILADWNALTITALARAAIVFNEPAWLGLADSVHAFILSAMGQEDGRIAHAYRNGKISAEGLLEDQAAMLRAALALHQATGSETYLAQALKTLAATETFFADGEGAFFMSASDAADVFTPRARHVQDGPTPSGIGMMAENYALLHHITGKPEYRVKAESLLKAYGGRIQALTGSPMLLAATDLLENATCIVVTGGGKSLAHTALASPDPSAIVLQTGDTANLPPDHPAHGKATATPSAFVCRGGICNLPVTSPEELRAQLRRP